MSIEQDVKQKALELGFDAVGITDASPVGREHVEHFHTWLESGCAGPLQYMHRNLEKRIDPIKLLDGVRSVIVVALSYKSQVDAIAVGWAPPTTSAGRIAQFAQYEDYHSFIKGLLRQLASSMQELIGGSHRFKLCVDSAPLAEKALVVRAGLGFIGKNHLLIHPQLGPQILLGELLTTAEFAPDEPSRGNCGDCDLCLRACPNGALRSDGLLDARECISCLTQHQPSAKIGNWLFGCDECLLACPHQQRAPACANRQFIRREERACVNLRELIELNPEEFEARFGDSPIARAGLDALKRNAQICLRNVR
ncbi:MAG: tRNA epoxyqueuosine(34) reductase QueG [Phycisphaerales bacterium]